MLIDSISMVVVEDTKMYFRFLYGLLRDQRGQDLMEYACMAGFVAVALCAAMPGLAHSLGTIFSNIASELLSEAQNLSQGPTGN